MNQFDKIHALNALDADDLRRAYSVDSIIDVELAQSWLFDVPPDDLKTPEGFARAVDRCAKEIKKWSLLLGDAMLEANGDALKEFASMCTSPFYRAIALRYSSSR